MYSFTLSLTSALDRVGDQRHVPGALPPGRPGTHCVGCWVGPRDGLDNNNNNNNNIGLLMSLFIVRVNTEFRNLCIRQLLHISAVLAIIKQISKQNTWKRIHKK